MKVEILDSIFNPWQEVKNYQERHLNKPGKFGATAIFVGTMRDFNAGDEVRSMYLEALPGDDSKTFAANCTGGCRQVGDPWTFCCCIVQGRCSRTILLYAWRSVQRIGATAYEANRFIMEDLKSKTPIWKKEHLKIQERWVAGNEGKTTL